jgi:hypothetical protein
VPELSPVDLDDIQVGRRHRDVVGHLSAQDANGQRADGIRVGRLAPETATDDAPTHRGVHPAVGRGVGYSRNPVQVVQRVEILPRAILVDGQIVDDGMCRERPQTRLELVGRQTRQVRDGEAWLERPELRLREILVRSGRSVDDEDVLDVRLQRSGERERAAEVQLGDDPGRIRRTSRHRAVGKEDDRCFRKQVLSICFHELERRAVHRDDDVESMPFVLLAQKTAEGNPVVSTRVPRPVDEF